jgi:hypothetical protein
MYADTLRKMNISLANLKPTDTRFHGITPEKPSYPLGKINLDVQFGTQENYRREKLEFEVVDLPSQYHALLGRPAYARFMAVTRAVGEIPFSSPEDHGFPSLRPPL